MLRPASRAAPLRFPSICICPLIPIKPREQSVSVVCCAYRELLGGLAYKYEAD